MNETRVYYNSACPVCRAGIAGQQRKLKDSGDSVQWIDVHTSPEAVCELGEGLEQVRERLHVVDESGRIHVGAEAFAELWSKTPGQTWLARLTRHALLRAPLGLLYKLFARLLYRWNRWLKHW